MSYNHSNPFIPPPPALPRLELPRFELPSEEGSDPLDVAVTAQRPAMDASRARRVVCRTEANADATSEVQIEDILLEVYAEDPPPRHGFAAHDHESPSVAPVAFPSAHFPLSGPVPAPPPYAPAVAPRRRRGAAVAIWTVALFVVGAGTGAGVTVGVRHGTYARVRDGAKELAGRVGSRPVGPAPPAPPAAPPPAPPAPPASLPTVSVDSLPEPAIAAGSSLVSFPAAAHGHRVFFDGRPMAVTKGPMTLPCGRHMIRIGTAGKARVTDLACGRALALP